MELKNLIAEFQSTAHQLGIFYKRSKELRKSIAQTVCAEIGPINEDEWTEFLIEDTLVSVQKAKLCDDFTVLYRKIPKL